MKLTSFVRHACPLLGLLALACPIAAQETAAAPAAPPALTLTDALHRAAERNPALLAQQFEERAAEARIEQAGYRPNPTLDVAVENFLGTGAVRGVRGLEATVEASQTLERGDKRARRIALAGRDREIAAHELAVQRAALLARTAIAFAEALAAQEHVTLAAEPLRLAQETLAAVDARVKAGAGSPAETARARAATATAQAGLTRAEAALTAARTALAATWGGTLAEVPALRGRIHVPDTLPSPDALLAALPHHPRLALQEAYIAQRRAQLELESAQARGDVTLSGGARFLRDGNDAALVAGFSVPLPVRHRNQGNIRAAREILAGAEQTRLAAEVALRAEFTAAWQELKTAHAGALALRRESLPAIAEAHAIVRRGYDEGLLSLLEVLEAQRALVEVRRELLEAEIAYAGALARLESLAAPTFPATTALFSSE